MLCLVGIVVAVYGTQTLFYPTVTFNYRLTIEATTPEGAKTGSGIIQVSYGSQFNLNGGGRKGNISVKGEAVYLDLGNGKNLFVTLTSDGSGRLGSSIALDGALDAEWLPIRIFEFKWDWGSERDLARQVLAAKSAVPKSVALIVLPTTVTFSDLADFRSVRLVDPRDMAAVFGKGYAIKNATLEITNAPPTEELEKILGWLPKLKKQSSALDGTKFPGPKDPVASHLGYLSFKNWGI